MALYTFTDFGDYGYLYNRQLPRKERIDKALKIEFYPDNEYMIRISGKPIYIRRALSTYPEDAHGTWENIEYTEKCGRVWISEKPFKNFKENVI